MTKEELTVKAEAGDVQAMLELVELLKKERDWNGAIDWADKAAQNNAKGMMEAAELHHLRLTSCLQGGAPFWGLLKEDARATQENAAVLIGLSREGKLNMPPEIYSHMIGLLRDGMYSEALICYVDGTDDYDRIIHLLRGVDTTREKALYALALFEKKEYDEPFRALGEVYRDEAYLRADKRPAEEHAFAIALFTYATMLRIEGSLDRAVAVLTRSIDLVKNEDTKANFRQELGKYRKKLFGGWQFMG